MGKDADDRVVAALTQRYPQYPNVVKYLGALLLNPPKPGGLTRTSGQRFPTSVVAARHLKDGTWQVRYESFVGYLPPREGDVWVAEAKNFATSGPEFLAAVESALAAAIKHRAWLD